MKCLVCGSDKLLVKQKKISDFLIEKIFGEDELSKDHSVNLCHCEECSFSFYDRRLTDEESEMKLLYDLGSTDTYYYLEVPSENPFEPKSINRFGAKLWIRDH